LLICAYPVPEPNSLFTDKSTAAAAAKKKQEKHLTTNQV
jgi:hypothetical protein